MLNLFQGLTPGSDLFGVGTFGPKVFWSRHLTQGHPLKDDPKRYQR